MSGTVRWLLGLLAALAACMHVGYPPAGEPCAPGAAEVLAFGRVRVLCDGREVVPGPPEPDPLLGPADPDVRYSLFHVEPNRRRIYLRVEPDGRFYWLLAPGTYLLYVSRGGAVPVNEPVAAFQVPAGGETAYVGELTLETAETDETRRNPLDYELVDFAVRDELDHAVAALRARHPCGAPAPARRLMITDPALPGLFRNYSRRRCERILARHGWRLLEGREPTGDSRVAEGAAPTRDGA